MILFYFFDIAHGNGSIMLYCTHEMEVPHEFTSHYLLELMGFLEGDTLTLNGGRETFSFLGVL